jgi:hypothetical protein
MAGAGLGSERVGQCASCSGWRGSAPIVEEDPTSGEASAFCFRCGLQRFLCRHPLVAEAGTGLCCRCQGRAMHYDAAGI